MVALTGLVLEAELAKIREEMAGLPHYSGHVRADELLRLVCVLFAHRLEGSRASTFISEILAAYDRLGKYHA